MSKGQEQAKDKLTQQPKEWKDVCDGNFPAVEQGSTLQVTVPEVVKLKGDAHNIAAVVEVTRDGVHCLGTRHGILK